MNISDTEQDLASLLSRIEQLEAEQNLRKQNVIWLKRYIDKFKQEFNTRPELQQIESLQQGMAQLSAQVTELQQRLNQLPTLSNSLNNTQITKASTAEANFDNAESSMVNRRRVRRSSSLPSPLIQQSTEALVQTVAMTVNTDAAKNEQHIDADTQEQQVVTALSDEEFKVERMMFLLDRIYAVEEESQGKLVSAEEILSRYNAGQRDFTGINLAGVNLSGKKFFPINLSKANLKKANLRKTNLNGSNLRQANLNESNLSGADLAGGVNLSEANLSRANLSGANMGQATLTGADLSNANLSKVSLIKANLEFANLNAADLQYSYYDEGTIFPTNFDPAEAGAYLIAPNASLKNANLAGATFNNVNLIGADLQGANLSQATLQSVNLTGAELSKANLTQTTLIQISLRGANLVGVNLLGASFDNVTMSGAYLSEANLCGVSLNNQDLNGANLTSADLRGAFLHNTNLQKANLKDAKLGGVNLEYTKLSGAIMPDGTIHE